MSSPTDAWLRPLSQTEDRLLWQVVEGIEGALSRDPALTLELLAVVFSNTVSHLVNGHGPEQATEIAERMMDFVLERTDLLMAEEAAEAMAEISVAGHA